MKGWFQRGHLLASPRWDAQESTGSRVSRWAFAPLLSLTKCVSLGKLVSLPILHFLSVEARGRRGVEQTQSF